MTEKSEIFGWYAQFTASSTPNLRSANNALKPVPRSEIDAVEVEAGLVLPSIYKEFLLEIGYGRLRKGEQGEEKDSFNHFLSPEEIIERLDRESAHWSIDPDLCGETELPFFEFEVASYFVFDLSTGSSDSVWMPNKEFQIASSFLEFLRMLRSDSKYYNEIFDDFDGI